MTTLLEYHRGRGWCNDKGFKAGDLVQTSLLRYKIMDIHTICTVGRLVAAVDAVTGQWRPYEGNLEETIFRSGEWQKVEAA